MPSASLVARSSTPASAAPIATPAPEVSPFGTISIDCFLSKQDLFDDFVTVMQAIESYVSLRPTPAPTDYLARFASIADRIEPNLTGAPSGCYSAHEQATVAALIEYLRNPPNGVVDGDAAEALLTATGFPTPSFNP